jgi:hypothetical protein
MKKETLVLFSTPMPKAMLEGRKHYLAIVRDRVFKIKKVKVATGKVILQKLNYMHNNPHPPIAISIT